MLAFILNKQNILALVMSQSNFKHLMRQTIFLQWSTNFKGNPNVKFNFLIQVKVLNDAAIFDKKSITKK